MASNVVIPKSPLIPIIQGKKPELRNAELLVSTGIASLDSFIGGGLPLGSALLVEEDAYNTYSHIILRYFVAEGVANSHSLLIASQDSKPSKILSELPAIVEHCTNSQDTSSNRDAMKIAWRYKNMKLMDIPLDTSFAHYYDLSKKMDKERLDKSSAVLWNGENVKCESNLFTNNAYMDLLLSIERTISQGEFRNVLRIAIDSLGSRLWLSDSQADTQKDLLKFMYMLKSLLQESCAVAIVTVPTLNYANCSTGIVERLEHLCDTVISLESFAGLPKAANPLFQDYHGLLNLKKLHAFNSLINDEVQHVELAFKLRKKNFVIEVLHLPPELADTTEREQDELSSSNSGCCGGGGGGGTTSANHKLDF